MIICPECDYQRHPTDYVPDWECPNCGIAYNKASGRTAERHRRQPVPVQLKKNTRPFFYIPVILFIAALSVYAYIGTTNHTLKPDAHTDGLDTVQHRRENTGKLYSKCGSEVCVEASTKGSTIDFSCESSRNFPMTLYFTFQTSNVSLSTGNVFSKSIAAGSTMDLTTGTVINPDKKYRWEYKYLSRYGDSNAQHNDHTVYQLPYRLNTSHKVTQSHHGKFSHHDIHSRYAIDFKMPVGTPVCAARAGYIAAVRGDSDIGGPDRDFMPDANFVKIVHDDGTVAHYLHLKVHGVRGNVGDYVQKGETIGFSGNTGFSSGPHLHFAVVKPGKSNQNISIPVRFSTGRGHLSTLRRGKTFTARL